MESDFDFYDRKITDDLNSIPPFDERKRNPFDEIVSLDDILSL